MVNPNFSNLQPIDSDEKLIRPTRRYLIDLYRKKFLLETGKQSPVTFSEMMHRMKGKFESIDEESDELFIEYPDEQTWRFELDGFFQDEYAEKNSFAFWYFLSKRYGGFGKYKKIVHPPSSPFSRKKQSLVYFKCPDCGSSRSTVGNCSNKQCSSNR